MTIMGCKITVWITLCAILTIKLVQIEVEAVASDVRVTCQSCDNKGSQLKGHVGGDLIVKYTASASDFRKLIIWYNGTDKIAMEPWHVDTKEVKDSRLKAFVNGSSRSLLVTLTKLTVDDNGAQFKYTYSDRNLNTYHGTNVLIVETISKFASRSQSLIVVAVVIGVIIIIILIVILLVYKGIISHARCIALCGCGQTPSKEVTEDAIDMEEASYTTPLAPTANQYEKVGTHEVEVQHYADPDDASECDHTDKFLPPSVFKWKLDRKETDDLLSTCGTPGVYILRKGSDKKDVLSAYLLNETRHYKIFVEGEEMFLRCDHPRFIQHLHLVMYYHENNLPTCHARLETPFRDPSHYENLEKS